MIVGLGHEKSIGVRERETERQRERGLLKGRGWEGVCL